MTRTMCCPKCGSEDVWEVEDLQNYTSISIDDKGDIAEVHVNENDFASAEPLKMWCSTCQYEQNYKLNLDMLGLTQNDVRLVWSKTEDE